MMSPNVRGISFIILVVVMILLPITANCDAKLEKSGNNTSSKRQSTVQIENERFLYSNAPVLNGIILGTMQAFLQRFGLGFLIDPVLVGILHLWDRIRKPLQYLFNLSPSMYLFNLR